MKFISASTGSKRFPPYAKVVYSWGAPAGNMSPKYIADNGQTLAKLSKQYTRLTKLYTAQLSDLFMMNPEHGVNHAIVDEYDKAGTSSIGRLGTTEVPNSDIIITTDRSIILGALPADCIIAVITDGNILALVHAGRRGTDLMIGYHAIDAIVKARPETNISKLSVWISPNLSPESGAMPHYDTLLNTDIWIDNGFLREVEDNLNGRYALDIEGFFTWQLTQKGIPISNITSTGLDTYQNALERKTFSHRLASQREDIPNGRFIVTAQLTSSKDK